MGLNAWELQILSLYCDISLKTQTNIKDSGSSFKITDLSICKHDVTIMAFQDGSHCIIYGDPVLATGIPVKMEVTFFIFVLCPV